jgi:hypothetical protein
LINPYMLRKSCLVSDLHHLPTDNFVLLIRAYQ